MSLKINYEMTCDFCGTSIGTEVYTVEPYQPDRSITLPMPSVAGRGVGPRMACDSCLTAAQSSLTQGAAPLIP